MSKIIKASWIKYCPTTNNIQRNKYTIFEFDVALKDVSYNFHICGHFKHCDWDLSTLLMILWLTEIDQMMKCRYDRRK